MTKPRNFSDRRAARRASAEDRAGREIIGYRGLKHSVKRGTITAMDALLVARGTWKCAVTSTRTGRWLAKRAR